MKKPVANLKELAKKRRLDKEIKKLSPFQIDKGGELSKEYFDLMDKYLFYPYMFKSRGKFGIKSPTGEIILPARYEKIKFHENSVKKGSGIAVQINGKWTIVRANGEGTPATKILFDDIDFLEIVSPVRLGDKFGLIKKNGRLFLPVKYESIEPGFIKGVFSFTHGNKYGVTNGKIITPQIFDEVSYEIIGEWICLVVSYGDRQGYIDEYGAFTEDFDLCYIKENIDE